MSKTAAEWRLLYRRRLAFADGAVVVWATVGAYLIRFQLDVVGSQPGETVTYAFLTLILSLAWWVTLGALGSREPTILGAGIEEYKRVTTASFGLFGAVAILSYAFQFDTARGYVGLALPAGLFGLLFSRWTVRQILRSERRRGLSNSRVVVVGGPFAADHLIRSLNRQPDAGYEPVAACLVGPPDSALLTDLKTPVVGHVADPQSIVRAVKEYEADTVAISSGAQLRPGELRRLGWQLSALNVGMILAPALTDVAGPRIHTQPVSGLPLIHVSTPRLSGGKWVTKRIFDIFVSSLLLILLSPLFLVTAVLVKMSSPGPVFYRQERVGVRGSKFQMIKFRSMRPDADSQLMALLKEQGSDGSPLSKIQNDPRITPIGRIIRKFSIDELPQLLNVLGGSMSLVGPRPQRDHEVALYDEKAHRRLYVPPGMSGLWQVSGRSNLTWEESIQLDLYYVENWSLTQDIVILIKTFRAVLASDGAI